MTLIDRFGVLNSKHIAAAMDMSMHSVYHRVAVMEQRGYLHRHHTRRGMPDALTLTAAGAKAAGGTARAKLRLATLAHDWLVADVLLSYAKSGCEFRTERELRAELYDPGRKRREGYVPDGLIKNGNGGWTALELEISYKTTARYEKVVREHLRNPNVTNVTFFCKSRSQAARLTDIVEAMKLGDFASVKTVRGVFGDVEAAE
ncbi:MAG: hypothetical protein AB1894_29570 [Chloroflexota bacterium]